jgi:hypothetical protein
MDLELYPSAATRWLNCTISPTIDVSDLPEETRDYAERGKRLHKIAEECLKEGHDAVPVGNLTPDDCSSVMEYVEFVRSRPGWKLHELKVEFAPGCRGYVDTLILDPPVLEIIDYKAGYWYVGPEENDQLTIYAYAVAKRFRAVCDFDRVRLTIAQPAANAFNSWELSKKELLKRAAQIRKTIERIQADEGLEYAPSEDRCKWCPAKTICPALEEHVNLVAAQDFRAADTRTMDEKMGLVPLLEEWCRGIKARARSMLLSGESIEGWKVVRGRRGNRAWKNEATARSFLTRIWELESDQIFKPRMMLTPSAIEKLVKGDETRSKKTLARLIDKGAEGPPTVVPESDNRNALTKADLAKEDFANLPDDEEE